GEHRFAVSSERGITRLPAAKNPGGKSTAYFISVKGCITWEAVCQHQQSPRRPIPPPPERLRTALRQTAVRIRQPPQRPRCSSALPNEATVQPCGRWLAMAASWI